MSWPSRSIAASRLFSASKSGAAERPSASAIISAFINWPLRSRNASIASRLGIGRSYRRASRSACGSGTRDGDFEAVGRAGGAFDGARFDDAPFETGDFDGSTFGNQPGSAFDDPDFGGPARRP